MSLITCPDGCEDNLAPVLFNDCAPFTLNGQIEELFITNIGYPLTDWTDANEWATRLSNSSTNPDAIRRLTVIGDMPAAESSIKIISGNRRLSGNKVHTINFRVDEVNDTNYDWFRTTECNGNYLIWIKDSNGYLFGGGVVSGSDGTEAFLQVDYVIPESRDELEIIQGIVTWDSKLSMDRIVSPI